MILARNPALLFAAALLVAPALAHADGADKKQKGTFVAVSDLAATALRLDGGHGVMTVEAGLDIPDPVLRNYADLSEPRLREAFAQVLQIYAGGLAPGRPPDVDYMARQFQAAADRVLGRPGSRLLLGGVMVN